MVGLSADMKGRLMGNRLPLGPSLPQKEIFSRPLIKTMMWMDMDAIAQIMAPYHHCR